MSDTRRIPSLLRSLALSFVAAFALVAWGCTSAPKDGPGGERMPLAPPNTASDKEEISRILTAWKYIVEHGAPPLTDLEWHVLKTGTRLPADSLLITDRGATVTLQMPLSLFLPSFVEFARAGRVLGYRVSGDLMDVDVQGETIVPLRPIENVTVPKASMLASAVNVKGVTIYSSDHTVIARSYAMVGMQNGVYQPTSAPSGTPRPVVSQAPEPVKVKKGLGIRGKDVSTLDEATRRNLWLKDEKGVYIDAVIPGSPADLAGLKAFDVIVQVNDVAIVDARDLMRALAAATADTVAVQVARAIVDDKTSKLMPPVGVKLGEFSGDARVIPPTAPTSFPVDFKSP